MTICRKRENSTVHQNRLKIRLFSAAEYYVKTVGRGRTVNEWKLRPERNDNHWLDCLAGCAVCGSMLGATMPEFGKTTTRKSSTGVVMRLSDIQKQKSGEMVSSMPVNTGNGQMKLSEIQKMKKR